MSCRAARLVFEKLTNGKYIYMAIKDICESVITSYQSGDSLNAVARKYSISKRQVGRILTTHGINGHQYYAAAHFDQVAAAIKAGVPRKDICRQFKTTSTWLLKHFGRAPTRKPNTQSAKYKDRIIELHNQGFTNYAIGKSIGKSWYFVRYVLRTNGLSENRTLDDATIATIRTMYNNGMSARAVAAELRICKTTVLKYLYGMIRPRRIHKGQRNQLRSYLRAKLGIARKAARDRSHVINITLDDLLELYEAQDHKCALTGIDMVPEPNCHESISIDRINNANGYTRENIRLTTRFANLARSTLSDKAFFDFIAKIMEANAPQEDNNV